MSPDSRITTFSTIKFRPTSSDNGVTWACEANHPALTNSGPLRTTVLLSVLRKYFSNSILITIFFFHGLWIKTDLSKPRKNNYLESHIIFLLSKRI